MVERGHMKEILNNYKKAENKTEENLYIELKNLWSERINGDLKLLKYYQMKCHSYGFSEFYISVCALLISCMALCAEFTGDVFVAGVTIFTVLFITFVTIGTHQREAQYKDT